MFGFTISRKKKEDEELEKKTIEDKVVRKKKKEPLKPWGRAERAIVFFLLFTTVLMSSILALSARSWKLPGMPLKLLPNLTFQKTYILEKPTNENFSIPIEQFQDLVADKTGVYSFFVARVYRDNSYGFRQYDEFESKSLAQLVLLWQIFYSSSKGDLTLSKDYVIRRADKIGETKLKPYAIGTTLSYRELAGMLCAGPDEAVEKIFVDALGAETLRNSLQKNLSLSTNIEEQTTTTADVGFMLKRIIESEILTSESKDEFVNCLKKTDDSEFRNIFNDPFDFKYNITARQASLAGIVFASKPYVLVVVGEGINEAEAREVLPKALRIIADFEN